LGRGWVDHELQECRDCCTGSLLKTRDRYPEYSPTSFPIGRIEFRLFEPAQKRGMADADGASRFLDVLLGERRRNRFFLFAVVFGARLLPFLKSGQIFREINREGRGLR
jgi:hypothetical protein